MGRLIDADRLNKEFSLIITHIENSNKETISKEEFCKCLKILRECVDEQPTAYNVEKVGAELEKEIQWAETHGTSADFRKGRISGLKTAIRLTNDIVKKGGIDERT